MSESCEWKEAKDGDYGDCADYWDTGCGDSFVFNDSGPKENNFEFCPYCGKTLEVIENDINTTTSI